MQVVFDRDPAARSNLEVLLTYPGLHAIIMHRWAHALWRHRWLVTGRWVSHVARFLTGIEIHPGATIGDGLFIDHGMGVVIGETAQIGNNVTLFKGVVLGGTGKEKGKRHPTIGNNVTIGSNAVILGSFTVGDNCKIGAGSVVLREVPPNCTVVGNPARIVRRHGEKVDPLDHINVPDPIANVIDSLQQQLERLEQRLAELEEERDVQRERLLRPGVKEDV